MIEAKYTLTFDDFREANGLPPVDSPQARWARWKLLSWVLVVGVVGAFFVLLNARVNRQTALFPAREPFPFTRLLLTMTPALALCLLFSFILFRSLRRSSQKPWILPPPPSGRDKNRPAPNTFARSVMGWVLFVALATIIFLLMQSHATAGRPGATPPTRLPLLFDFMLPVIPLFVLLLALSVFAGLSARQQIPRMWEAMRHEQQPRTLRADAEAIVIEQETAHLRYAWRHFAGYKETKNLLMVYLSPYSFHMLPKRGFATPADLDSFKGLLMNGVAEGSFLPSEQVAFPVLPIAQVAAVQGEQA